MKLSVTRPEKVASIFFKINFFGIAMPKAVVLAFLPMLKTGKAKVKRFAKLIARQGQKQKRQAERRKSSASRLTLQGDRLRIR